MVNYENYKKALKNLILQFDNFLTMPHDLPLLTQEAIGESVIQRFEVCFYTQWKVLKQHLSVELGLPEIPNSPRPIFRIAAEGKILPLEAQQWMYYVDARIGTSHDYSGEKAAYAIKLIPAYLNDSINLYEAMSGKAWE